MRDEWRESGDVHKPARLEAFEASWEYAENTCAADGMCQEKCPVKINTGELIKSLRKDALESKAEGEAPPRGLVGQAVAGFVGAHFGTIAPVVPVRVRSAIAITTGVAMIQPASAIDVCNRANGSFVSGSSDWRTRSAAKTSRPTARVTSDPNKRW